MSFVSIQLISPASGDLGGLNLEVRKIAGSFHSINIPSEWGPLTHPQSLISSCFHSINIPSEWGPQPEPELHCTTMFPFN